MPHDHLKGSVYRITLAARMSIILSHSEVLLGQNHSLWDSMMLILAAREILYTSPLRDHLELLSRSTTSPFATVEEIRMEHL